MQEKVEIKEYEIQRVKDELRRVKEELNQKESPTEENKEPAPEEQRESEPEEPAPAVANKITDRQEEVNERKEGDEAILDIET